MRSTHIINGQGVVFKVGQLYHDACCDCGLSHLIIPKRIKGGVQLTYYRDDWQTRINRRRKKKR